MPLRRAKPIRFEPMTVCDAVDGTNGVRGGMTALTNLLPALSTRGTWSPRPAAVMLTDFPSAAQPGFVSGLLVIGNIAYGMFAGGLFPGFDQPFAYNLLTNTFLSIAGIVAGNVPKSPLTTGDWTPPILAQVGTRIVVTHPGFPGGTGNYFGWLDISNFSQSTNGNVVSGSPTITGNPSIFGVQPGLLISGTDIPANTSIVSTANFVLDTTGTTHAAARLENIADTTNIEKGMTVTGTGIPASTKVLSLNADDSVSINKNATAAGSGVALTFSISIATTGDTLNTSFVILNVANIDQIEIGMSVTGTDIAASSFVVSIAQGAHSVTINNAMTGTTPGQSLTFAYTNVTTGDVFIGAQITSLASTTGVAVGQQVFGAGIPIGATVVSIDSATQVSITPSATVSASGVAITFSGATITMSANGTGNAPGTALSITGGSPTAPLWAAGNTNTNPLTAVPVSVAQMAGSAHFAVGPAVVISDPLLACQVTNASQVLTFGNNLPVTALGPLPLDSLLGGIVQAIIAFQGEAAMQQITGNPATLNVMVNQLPVPTGTLAPLTIIPMTKGLAFISPEGLRIIEFTATITDPIGAEGKGVAVPFSYAVNPSRMCAAATSDALRISVQNGSALNNPPQEFWFDLTRKTWSGPHTFPASQIQPWGKSFALAPISVVGSLWQSDVLPDVSDTYIENGVDLSFSFETSLLPDNEDMAENAIVESALGMALPFGQVVTVNAIDDSGVTLDSVQVTGSSGKGTIWGQFIWGEAVWGGNIPLFYQYPLNWHFPLTFKQCKFQVSGNSAAGDLIGNLYLRYQILGYLMQRGGGA